MAVADVEQTRESSSDSELEIQIKQFEAYKQRFFVFDQTFTIDDSLEIKRPSL